MKLIKKMTVAYDDLKDYIQTGDIVLMHGNFVSSHIIEHLEHSSWSHAAIAVRPKDLGIESEESVLLWESNGMSEVKDIILDHPKKGPQLVSLHQRMKINFGTKDDSQFAIRHLYTDRTQEMFDTINSVIKEYHEKSFPIPKKEFAFPILGRVFDAKVKQDYIFCSELVAITYQALKLLSDYHPVNAYIPADFTENNDVGLLKRAWLGNEIIIDPQSL